MSSTSSTLRRPRWNRVAKREPNATETTPAGHVIEFYDSIGVDGEKQQRRYVIDGERLPSVTTVTGIFDKSRAFVKKALELERQGLDWYTYTDEAAKRGTEAHDWLVKALAEGASLDGVDDAYRPWVQQGASWLFDREPKVIEAERMIVGYLPVAKDDGYTTAPAYSGRFDLLCELDGLRTLVDFKTLTKPPYKWKDGERNGVWPPYPENALQLNAYAAALPHTGYPEAEQLCIVRLWDGGYDETPAPFAPSRFEDCFNAYRAKLDTEAELRKAVAA